MRGCSDDLFIKFVDKNLNSITQWIEFKQKYAEKDIIIAKKLVVNRLNKRQTLKGLIQ
jgi:hypothetical protein